MKQIGARQEAGRIGGTGPCGRELCCATWMKNFVSVSTNAARYQDISLNPQKLAGLCAKLKCCLNYEVDDYVEASRKMPNKEVTLFTQDNEYFLFKTDILAGLVSYSTQKGMATNLETITAERAKEIIELNKHGEKPETLSINGNVKEDNKHTDLLADADISRFDKSKKKKSKNKNKNKNKNSRENRPADANNEAQLNEEGKTAKQDDGNKRNGEGRQPNEGRQPRRQDRNNRHNNQQRNKNRQQPKDGNGAQPKQQAPQAQPKPQAPQQ